jgi:hypothetical protein
MSVPEGVRGRTFHTPPQWSGTTADVDVTRIEGETETTIAWAYVSPEAGPTAVYTEPSQLPFQVGGPSSLISYDPVQDCFWFLIGNQVWKSSTAGPPPRGTATMGVAAGPRTRQTKRRVRSSGVVTPPTPS